MPGYDVEHVWHRGATVIMEIRNAAGMTACFSDYGAALTRLLLPGRAGELVDVVLGYDTVTEYTQGCAYFGATIGRIANRIRDGRFMLGDEPVVMDRNDNGRHALHGG
ncbi:MAG: hypothetical protein LBH11_05170, partial [Propionibacteriaceae bacterium]|nr:hypothetical protein [Propionibacteriaceae bacterium]